MDYVTPLFLAPKGCSIPTQGTALCSGVVGTPLGHEGNTICFSLALEGYLKSADSEEEEEEEEDDDDDDDDTSADRDKERVLMSIWEDAPGRGKVTIQPQK